MSLQDNSGAQSIAKFVTITTAIIAAGIIGYILMLALSYGEFGGNNTARNNNLMTEQLNTARPGSARWYELEDMKR